MANGTNPGGDGTALKTAGEGANAEPDETKNAGKSGDTKNDGKAAAGGDNGEGEGDEPKLTLTQKELDRMIQKRIDRATKDADDRAKLSKDQLLERERDEALKRANLSDARDAFITQMPGIEYGLASRLFKMYAADIEFDDKGKPENLADVIKTAKAENADFFKRSKQPKGGGDLGEGNGDDGKPAGGNMNDTLRKAFRRI